MMEIIERRNHIPRLIGDSRSFSAKPVEPQILQCLLKAAGETPSHGDEQPWNLILETSGSNHDHISDYLTEADSWARRAPVLMIVVVRLASTSNYEPNIHAFRDARHAVSNLMLRAASLGLLAHEFSAFDARGIRKQFLIPVGCIPVTVIALGHAAAANETNNYGADPEKAARPIGSFVFSGIWGQPYEFPQQYRPYEPLIESESLGVTASTKLSLSR